jgi:hypothetical protein
MTLSRPSWTPFCWERGESGRQEKSGGASALPRRAHTYETETERERERKNKEREAELTRRRVPLLMVLCSWSSAPLLVVLCSLELLMVLCSLELLVVLYGAAS